MKYINLFYLDDNNNNGYIDKTFLTKYAKVCDLLQGSSKVAARLEAASIGINIYMANRLLDANAQTQRASSESVKDIYKVSVVWRQASVSMFTLKVRTGWV